MTKAEEQEKKDARKEAYQDVKMYIANDWKLKEETPEFFKLTRSNASTMGHVLIFMFFGWYLLGVPNLIYWAVKKESKKILK